MTATEGFVLDSSTALAWCFPDEHASYPQSVLDSLAVTAAYDASYLELAVRRGLPLASLDGKLNAAAAAGIVLYVPAPPGPKP